MVLGILNSRYYQALFTTIQDWLRSCALIYRLIGLTDYSRHHLPQRHTSILKELKVSIRLGNPILVELGKYLLTVSRNTGGCHELLLLVLEELGIQVLMLIIHCSFWFLLK